MLVKPLLRARARTALAAGVALVVGVTLLTAAPAGAQLDPPAESTAVLDALAELDDATPGRFDLPIVALLRAVHRAERAGVADLTGADEVAKADRGCLDAGPADADIPTLVGAIFRCRLLEAGVDQAQADRWAAEALVVSQCESRWDTDAVVFDGRYLDTPHANGNRYSAAGVFQFIRATAEKWVDGGYANVHEPRHNVDAAARLFIHNRAAGFGGWEDWACAAANDGFKVGSVLPGWPGGPAELPEWAWQH